MNKKHFFILNIDIYHLDIFVSYNQTDKEFLKSVKQYRINDEALSLITNLDDNVMGRTVLVENGGIMLRLKKQHNTIELYSLLAHEVFHVTTMAMNRIGDSLEVGTNDDAYAYLQEHITRKILSKLK
jgi:hypothetical protein